MCFDVTSWILNPQGTISPVRFLVISCILAPFRYVVCSLSVGLFLCAIFLFYNIYGHYEQTICLYLQHFTKLCSSKSDAFANYSVVWQRCEERYVFSSEVHNEEQLRLLQAQDHLRLSHDYPNDYPNDYLNMPLDASNRCLGLVASL